MESSQEKAASSQQSCRDSHVYIFANGAPLCSKCTNRVRKPEKILHSGTYWTGPPIACSICGKKIHSVKGENDGASGQGNY